MIEKGRISARQMAIMMNQTILATALLLVPAITGKFAKQDMWISPLWASTVGFLTVYITNQLHNLYPRKTVIEYSQNIVGAFFGKAIGVLYICFYIHINAIVLREYGEFVVGTFLTRTPMIFIIGAMTLVCAYAVRSGLEVIARTAEIVVPVVILLFLTTSILLIPELNINKMLPIMDRGIGPSLMGATIPASWFSEFFVIAFLLPFLVDQQKSFKWSILSVLSVLFMMFITNIFTLLLLGNITAKFVYPVMSAIRYISIAEFLQHLESIVMGVWVAGTYIKISVFYYATVLGTAQLLNLSDYRPLVLPIGLLLVIVSIWSMPDLSSLSHFLGTTGVFYLTSIQTGIPILLLLIALVRKKIQKIKSSNDQNLKSEQPSVGLESGNANE
ncbi:GerAB/ArcD/ProY family transporter [Calidifontibacillus erzurumensis]|uniref:GerAB/ArcD/ProY family transporter n=1 Tax=Calidifontibacillus erzurumensis TaxID=2741433 RepID=UPI0035B56744